MSDLSEAEEQLWVSSIEPQIAGLGMLSERLAANDPPRPAPLDQDAGKPPTRRQRVRAWLTRAWLDGLWDNPWAWRVGVCLFAASLVTETVVR